MITPRLRSKLPMIGLLVAVGLVLAAIVWIVGMQGQRIDALTATLQTANADRKALDSQIRALGAKPVVPTKPRTPDNAAPPTTVTPDQVRAIVAEELAGRAYVMSASQLDEVARRAAAMVPKPADGRTPTAAEVRQVVTGVVAAVCANDACKGPKGDPGDPGKDAPPITDAQIDARLDAYCDAHDGCRGPQGLTGERGEKGDTGQTGPAGPAGPEGPAGPVGPAGFPGSWTFTIPGQGLAPSHTYTCTDPDLDRAYTCEEAQ